ncbi:FtsP/CotA-like multicopper oxidase with cupredoxin domain [Arthrobacter globiformis]|uniref:multicopper oxidase domain-containing protein n=1 Tax=Arthrobacter globiformis TaxID=1665 RepID=UPI0027855FA6|nr:multicopper oxidase domain-containing protein [Arthrobacter globiformis]MDQ1060031.1 FtsP/CotA-like multicopper oxidase with cupredoxin domain [Arthrobacter globiformis]
MTRKAAWTWATSAVQGEFPAAKDPAKDVTRAGDPGHPDDVSKEDLAALDPGESVVLYRGFRDFVGPYVAHCHNLAHEDHAMMFGWSITP